MTRFVKQVLPSVCLLVYVSLIVFRAGRDIRPRRWLLLQMDILAAVDLLSGPIDFIIVLLLSGLNPDLSPFCRIVVT